ncbi:MAG: alpha/beta hydrolase [Lachnospiraceae bacterium]|nr:alpha/beta hydrolase [Ruminococcus sp.]MCM1273822.1 alpha/beta hydrolase [Lachnospiraceae bacterium]
MNKKKKRPLKIALIILALLAVVFAAGMTVTSVMMADNFSRGDYSDPRFIVDYYYEHYRADYPRTEVEFKSGKNTLKGFIYGSENDKALLVFAHGIGSGHEEYMKELLWFVDNGWRVFAYDATGSGHSGGSGTRGLPQSALDLDAALTFAESDERLNALPTFLMGHSWGGYAVTAALSFDHDVKGAASISGYNEPIEMILEWTEGMMGGFRYAMYPFIWTYNKALFEQYSSLSAVGGINKSNAPVLIIHGTEDGTIGYGKSSIISEKEKITDPNAQYLTLDGAGHNNMFYTKEALEYIDKLNENYRAVYDRYGGEIPDDVRAEFYAASDRELVNTPNEELLGQIKSFFEEQIG